MSTNLSLCKQCGMWTIAEETHTCPLKSVKFVGHTKIGNAWYIDKITRDGYEWETIEPIPIPSHLKSDDFLQGDKNKDNRRGLDST